MKQQEDSFDAFDVLARELQLPTELTPEEEEVINSRKKSKELPNEEEEPELIDESDLAEDEEEVEETEENESVEDTTNENEPTDVDTLGEYEQDITKYVSTKLEEKLGVSFGDLTKVEDIVDELAKMVDESTKDVFANDEVSELNEYVRNGGDLKKFYSEVYNTGIDIDAADIENVSDQRKIVKENLKNRGYSDKQVERMITRYEDSGVLQEEAEDALEVIKEYRENKKKELLAIQQKNYEESKKRNEAYINNVQKVIKELKDVRGIPVSEKEKKDLYKYIFVPDSDGKTQFQKDSIGNAKNLIESAFFTMKGDALIQRAQSKGATNTAKTLKDKLSQKGNRTKKSGTKEDNVDAIDFYSKYFRK